MLPEFALSQTYYYPGGKITQSQLNNSRPYKKGTYLLQGSQKGVVWIPKHDSRGIHYLELMLEHFMSQQDAITDFSPVQVSIIAGGSHGIASVLALCMDREARSLLQITKEQGKKIDEMVLTLRQQLEKRMDELRRVNAKTTLLEQELQRLAEIERLSILLETQLESFLSQEQITKSKETVFLLYGGFQTPVVDLGILSCFDLSLQQREELETIAEDANSKRDKIFRDFQKPQLGAADYQMIDSSMQQIAKNIGEKVRSVMKPEQLEKADKLISTIPEIRAKLGL
ncbi:MAG: hypothetical protein ACRCUY_12210 [Thermoguttaceae bacterium]